MPDRFTTVSRDNGVYTQIYRNGIIVAGSYSAETARFRVISRFALSPEITSDGGVDPVMLVGQTFIVYYVDIASTKNVYIYDLEGNLILNQDLGLVSVNISGIGDRVFGQITISGYMISDNGITLSDEYDNFSWAPNDYQWYTD